MYIQGVKQAYPHIEPGTPALSASSIVGNLIFLSGLTGENPDTGELKSTGFEDQLIGCLDNVKKTLSEASSSLDNIVKLIVLIKGIYDCPIMWNVLRDYCKQNAPALLKEPPAVTIIPVESLRKPDQLIELDVTAVLSGDMPEWEVKRYSMPASGDKGADLDEPGATMMSGSVSVGNLLFLSGMLGDNPQTGMMEPNDLDGQMDIAFNKVLAALDESGSSASNIVKTFHLQTWQEPPFQQFDIMQVSYSPMSDRLWKRELEHYETHAPFLLEEFPASTFLKLPCNPIPDSLVQLEVTSVLNRYRPGWVVKKYPLYLGHRGFPRHIGETKKYYANTVAVGNLVLISGQTPTDAVTGKIETETFEDQLRVALHNLKWAIEETGSTLEHLVKTYIFLPDLDNYGTMRKIEMEFYQKYAPALVDSPPASTLIRPYNLASPKISVEIDGICLIPQIN
jgi:2-iminobutanoate/2-iminopropanoate deaminase